MDRRQFIKGTAVFAAATVVKPKVVAQDGSACQVGTDGSKLITSAPMLQNFASTSIGIAFCVSDMANGFVKISEHPDMTNSKLFKCGGYRVTDVNDKVMLIRITGLKPAKRYYYTIGADRISYKGGYDMKILGTETDPRIYSFITAGCQADGHFCVINDTHAHFDTFGVLADKIAALAPACVIWNGDATNNEATIESQRGIFLNPPIARKDFASETPYLFCPGNHDSRGMANRHIEKVMMFRQPEERSSRDWDLGRNFAVRLGDIALIGLDTAEDKLDTNPLFAGLFTSEAYREAQVDWLYDALHSEEIASAPYLVAVCHIPLHDDDPTHNPGDVFPADKDPQYKSDFAYWQRTCANLWTPLLQKAGCQVIITAHMHQYRFDAPDAGRKWAQIVGGGPDLKSDTSYPTVIEGKVTDGKLKIYVHNAASGKVVGEHTFEPR